ncbi:MAG: D-2-hydroxyacid dehydrogenase [Oscillospiraceae bacterium]|jgi:phosphoglycerate dehydrogenase-like enzyme|nr:D-2-hydroxyacid dehydrogenase [Oscillospiraceae bacterium]
MEYIINLLRLTQAQRSAFARAAQGHEQIFAPDGTAPDGSPLPAEVYRRATAILGNPPPELLRECRSLRLLQTRTAGVDRYNRPGTLPPGTALYSASGAYGQSVSEHMFAVLLSLMKRLPGYRDQQRQGLWADLGPVKTLDGAVVLCLGVGDLGSCFCKLCKAMGAHTLGIRRDLSKAAPGVDELRPMEELDELLPRADVVALMLPHAPDTVHVMDWRRLELMRPDAILLNGGRGSAVDCAALAQVMEAGRLWGAGLDVTDPEPLPPDHPLWRQERAIITPHSAGDAHLAVTMDRVAAIALERLRRFL